MFGRILISLTSTVFCFLRASEAFFCDLVLQLAQIDNLAYRHIAGGIDLDEIEARLFSHAKRLVGWQDTMVMAFGVDELDLCGPDILVSAGAFISGRRRSERSANGFGLLNNWSCSAGSQRSARTDVDRAMS
jgi:hypothetical protein